MTWRGVCFECGDEVVWAGDEGSGAQPDLPGPGRKTLCLACVCFGTAPAPDVPLLLDRGEVKEWPQVAS